MSNEETSVLVISFECSITRPQLEQLVERCDGEWRRLSVPLAGRDRLLAAIKKAIADMSDEHGRITPDMGLWQDAVEGLE